MAAGNYQFTMTAVNDNLTFPIRTGNTLGITLTGNFNATVIFEGSKNKGQDWETVFVYPYNSSTGAYGTAVSTANAVGSFAFPTAGFSHFRVKCTSFTSGALVAICAVTEGTLVTAPTSGGGGTTTNNVTNNVTQTDSINILGNTQITQAIATTGSQTAVLTAGIYHVSANVDCFLKVGATASDVTISTGYPLYANNTIPLTIPTGGSYKVGVVGSASGTLTLFKVN